jgi:hypothetical protein
MIPITWHRSKAFLEGRTDRKSVLSYVCFLVNRIDCGVLRYVLLIA